MSDDVHPKIVEALMALDDLARIQGELMKLHSEKLTLLAEQLRRIEFRIDEDDR